MGERDWKHVAHLLRLGRPLCIPDPDEPVPGLFTLYPSATTCEACCTDPAFQGELAAELQDDDGTDTLWMECGAANCGASSAWVDPAGVGWCSAHLDGGMYLPPTSPVVLTLAGEALTLETLDAAIAKVQPSHGAVQPLIARALDGQIGRHVLQLVDDPELAEIKRLGRKCERPACRHTFTEHERATPSSTHLRCTVAGCPCAAGRDADGLWRDA